MILRQFVRVLYLFYWVKNLFLNMVLCLRGVKKMVIMALSGIARQYKP